MRYVAVYHDEGTGEFSRGCLMFALAEAFRGRAQVRRIYAAELVASDAWQASTELLAIPGGADRPYCAKLDGAGNASIMRYLEGGGRLLGVCAGAYYMSARIAFEAESPAAITGARELALWKGVARGSLHALAEPYALDHLRCAAVARVYAPALQRELPALYWGGPELIPDADADAEYTPLLRYGRDGALAAVRVRVGRGAAVLTGVHAEISGTAFANEVSRFGDDSFEHGMRVCEALQRVDDERRALFDHLLAALTAA
jgi:glutamine amidotransferase-like uncharacterized protein